MPTTSTRMRRGRQGLARSNAVSLKAIRYHEHPSVYLSIPLRDQTWDEYLAGRSRNLRSQLGRKRRALERLGTVRFRRGGDDLEDAMNTLFDLHARALGRERKHDLQLANARASSTSSSPAPPGARLAAPLVPRRRRETDRSLVRLEHRRPVPVLPGGVRPCVVAREPRASAPGAHDRGRVSRGRVRVRHAPGQRAVQGALRDRRDGTPHARVRSTGARRAGLGSRRRGTATDRSPSSGAGSRPSAQGGRPASPPLACGNGALSPSRWTTCARRVQPD